MLLVNLVCPCRIISNCIVNEEGHLRCDFFCTLVDVYLRGDDARADVKRYGLGWCFSFGVFVGVTGHLCFLVVKTCQNNLESFIVVIHVLAVELDVLNGSLDPRRQAGVLLVGVSGRTALAIAEHEGKEVEGIVAHLDGAEVMVAHFLE